MLSIPRPTISSSLEPTNVNPVAIASVPSNAREYAVDGNGKGKVVRFRRRTPAAPVAENFFYQRFKVTFDICGSLLLLIATAPAMVIIAVLIKCTSPGPIIFKQDRLTAHGKKFTILKFRTMKVSSDSKSAFVWTEKNDPRVTRVGSFLRITRLDELPQLFNVLKGDMSLIGPRPERPEFTNTLAKEIPGFHRRLQIKAGLTGLAQVGNGYTASIEDYRKKLAWDRLYILKQSVWLDLWITLKTIAVVISGRGAR